MQKTADEKAKEALNNLAVAVEGGAGLADKAVEAAKKELEELTAKAKVVKDAKAAENLDGGDAAAKKCSANRSGHPEKTSRKLALLPLVRFRLKAWSRLAKVRKFSVSNSAPPKRWPLALID